MIKLRTAHCIDVVDRHASRGLLRLLLACLLASLGGCVTIASNKVAASPPLQAPQGRSVSDPMFQFSGTWQGRIESFDAPRFQPGSKGQSMDVRFVMEPREVKVFWRPVSNANAPWTELKSGLFSGKTWGPQAVVSSLTSGKDKDGLWVESLTFTLVHDSPMTLVAYYVRAVNNLDLPAANPDAHFAWGGSGQFQRVDEGTE